ncbi:MAG TPA: CHAT domain-containing tetratricopeptide repeat protein [Pseudonocardiaceae bacterium]|nr:CHAT domain-containing tetratricopeptide repeat protein [Pseudonocardiaceae bacterium]
MPASHPSDRPRARRADPVTRADEYYQSARQAMNAYRPHEAVVLLRKALRLLDDNADPADPAQAELRVRMLISLAFSDAEERGFDNGLEHLRTASTVLPGVQQPRVRAQLDATIEAQHGLMLMRVGRFDESVEVLDRAVVVGDRATAQGFPDPFALGSNLMNRGLANSQAGRPAQALRDLRRSIEVSEAGMQAGEDTSRLALLAAKAHHNLGFVAWRVNDIPRALRHYRDADHTFAELDPSIMPQLRIAQADALLAAGLAEEAARHLDEALPQMLKNKDQRNLAAAEVTRASAALVDGDHATARKFASSARRRFRRRGNRAWAAIAALIRLRSEAVEALDLGRVPAALPQRALALAEQLADVPLIDEAAVARMSAVRLLVRRGEIAAAEQQLALVPAPRRVTPVDHRMLLRLCRAELAVASGRRRAAFAQARGGLAELSRMRDRMGGLELVSGTAVHGRELGELAVRLVLEQPRSAARRLFTWLERTRAQIYRYEPLPALDDPELTERVQQYRMLSKEVQQARLAGRRLTELNTRHAALQREVMRLGWRDGPWGRSRPIASLDEVAVQLGNRVLVSFVVSGGQIAAVAVADGRATLVRLGDAAHAVNAARELRADLDALSPDHLLPPIAAAVAGSARLRAARLDEQLLRPLAGIIGDRELVVVPTGDLYAVAWGALPSLHGRPVSVAPSATAWLTAMRTPSPAQPGGIVLAAGPDLRAAEAEIGRLRENYPDATQLDGTRAGVREVLDACDGARLAHLAAHGTHEPENALFSSLELADGALHAHEMSRLRRPPEHVVLAACELALARIRPGDEALGFGGALLAIGSRTVTAPVTRVGDAAAAAAMTDYHRRLADGAPPAVALAATTAVDPLRRPFISLGASR